MFPPMELPFEGEDTAQVQRGLQNFVLVDSYQTNFKRVSKFWEEARNFREASEPGLEPLSFTEMFLYIRREASKRPLPEPLQQEYEAALEVVREVGRLP